MIKIWDILAIAFFGACLALQPSWPLTLTVVALVARNALDAVLDHLTGKSERVDISRLDRLEGEIRELNKVGNLQSLRR